MTAAARPLEPFFSGLPAETPQALWDAPRASTLTELVSIPASRFADLPAVTFSPDGRGGEPLTWSGLWQRALARGAALAARIAPGEPVVIAAPTSPEFFEAFFGVLTAGGVPVPIAPPPSLKLARLAWYQELLAAIAADTSARVLLTTSRFAPTLSACLEAVNVRMGVDELDSPVPAQPGWTPVMVQASALGLLQYTSGSTSRPKGVALTHGNLLANAAAINEAVATPESTSVCWLPLYHDMGLIGGVLSAFYTRRPLVLLPTTTFVKDPASWLRAIGATQATVTLAPHFAYQHAARNVAPDQVTGVSLASLRTALNGAEPIDPAGVELFERTFAPLGLRPGTVQPVYGLAESSLAEAFAEPGGLVSDDVDAASLEEHGVATPAAGPSRRRTFVSVGRAIPSQELRIVDAADVTLGDRRVGEVVVRGPSVMSGYYNRPEETAAALRGGWLHTGDLGYIADGRLYLTGRSRDLIIRYGRNYYPADIEAVVAKVDGLGRGVTAAFGLTGEGGEQVVVIAETRERDAEAHAQLARQVRERMQDAFLFGPDEVVFVPLGSVPRTTSGKVRREACRRLYESGDFAVKER